MEVKEAEESTFSHKQVNIQFRIWVTRNQEVLNVKNEKGLKKKKSSKRRETKKVVFCPTVQAEYQRQDGVLAELKLQRLKYKE